MKISCRRTIGLAAAAGTTLFLGAGSSMAQTVVYDNTTTGTGYYFGNATAAGMASGDEFGDQITVVGGAPTVSEFVVGLYSGSDVGNCNVRVRFYYPDGAGGNPGTIAWDSGLLPRAYIAGLNVYTVVVPNVTLSSDTFIWTAQVTGRTSTVAGMGPMMYNPPTVGTSDPAGFWYNPGGTGWGNYWFGAPPAPAANFYAKVSAVATSGACCLPNGTCQVTSSSNCIGTLGGVFQGTGSVCGTCPQPGACCKTDGTCVQTTTAGCTALGGVYSGVGVTCAAANCPQPPFVMNCTIAGSFTDIAATGTPIIDGDDAAGPFTSSVTNALVTNPNLYACTNGFISDSATFTAFTNTTLPTAAATFGLFPDWDDLFVDPATVPPGTLVHKAVVEGGVPVHIIQWNQVRTYGGTAQGSFQVKIFGAGGPALVQYIYRGMAWNANGASSTVGFQWGAGLAHQASFNTPGSIADNSVCSIVASGGPACYANCDQSTTVPCLNVLDFGCFLNAFAAGASYANCDNSTTVPVLNVLDFGCFLNRFAAGCSSC